MTTYLFFTDTGILYESFQRDWHAILAGKMIRARKVENIFGRAIWRLHSEA